MINANEVHDAGFKVPRTIQELRTYLQAALEVEHLTIPVYMTGMYTIRPGTNSTAYYTIRSVLLEEMLHMTMAANLLNAVGGEPEVAHPEFIGKYPAQLPMSSTALAPIGLRHFSREALNTFLAIEKPRAFHTDEKDGAGWTSIGQFYDTVGQGIRALVEEQGEHEVFTGSRGKQVGPGDFYNSGGEVFHVTGLDTALTALEMISEQGEGVHDSIWDSDDQLFGEERQLAHYFRFNEIAEGRCYSPNDAPQRPPSGPMLDVTWEDTYPIKGDSTVAEYGKYQHGRAVHRKAVAFNETYATLLSCLETAFRGAPQTMAMAVPIMLELRDLAQQLYRNPHPNPAHAKDGYFASATFEISTSQMEQAKQRVADHVAAVGLEAGQPVDLSRDTVGSNG
ncbi:ferritin-like domain-containing protein [Nocardiopsis xinjiangensis]|uniref:ferritin-like domain-containing protein n=1 Tax=Nocardiopsis xinjiangensis TaxID=124285 RepID=UPI00034BCC09|nr:ferritin-like protein [Nocardiopsis xinjiangensis]